MLAAVAVYRGAVRGQVSILSLGKSRLAFALSAVLLSVEDGKVSMVKSLAF